MSDKRRHPTQYSPEVLDVFIEHGLIRSGQRYYDPFAGPGLRLGRQCDEVGAEFSGGDIEWWGDLPEGQDPRVKVADALDPASYPKDDRKLRTSPVYQNIRSGDYRYGPKPGTNGKGRRDLGIALGHALHPKNLAIFTRQSNRAARRYWETHEQAVQVWADRYDDVVVNVDEPISARWCHLLEDNGYTIVKVIPAYTQGYSGFPNDKKRRSDELHEVVIVAVRGETP